MNLSFFSLLISSDLNSVHRKRSLGPKQIQLHEKASSSGSRNMEGTSNSERVFILFSLYCFLSSVLLCSITLAAGSNGVWRAKILRDGSFPLPSMKCVSKRIGKIPSHFFFFFYFSVLVLPGSTCRSSFRGTQQGKVHTAPAFCLTFQV